MDILHVDMSEDFDFRLEFDIKEDIQGELADFVRLVRLNRIKEARSHFRRVLLPHAKLFPVFAEYAELLVSEHSYQELLETLPESQNGCGYSREEWLLVEMLKTLAMLHTEKDVDGAWQTVRRWPGFPDAGQATGLNAIQIQCLEIWLQIYVDLITILDSLTIQLDGSQPSAAQAQPQNWQRSRQLIFTLLEKHQDWEAHKFLLLLLRVSTQDEAYQLFSDYLSKLRSRSERDETEIIARLNVTSAYLNHVWLHGSRQPLATLIQLNSMMYQDLAALSLDSPKAKFRYVGMIGKIYTGYLYRRVISGLTPKSDALEWVSRSTQPLEALILPISLLILLAITDSVTDSDFLFLYDARHALSQQNEPGALISTQPWAPMKQTYTGNKYLDRRLTILVSLYFSALDGTRPDASLIFLYSWGQNLALWILIHAESMRAANRGKLILTSVTALGLMAVFIGHGRVVPLWFAIHLWTSPTVLNPFAYQLTVDNPFKVALLPFGVITGLGIPTLVMCLPAPALVSFETKQVWTAIYQLWPICVYLSNFTLTTIAICVNPRASILNESEKAAMSQKYFRRTLLAAIIFSAGTHLTYLALLIPQVRAVLPVADSSTHSSQQYHLRYIARLFYLQWSSDIAVGGTAVFIWGLALRLPAKIQELSLYTATKQIITTILVAALLGPSAAAAIDIMARDGNILLPPESTPAKQKFR
ncbi:hypothetical protein AYL99_07970 [Fonsecaea erecta]|uniref:Uncharacterized protein n=1 Tax=Fonsecaea erecta TaxID=1367422 RepID=A0A178ZC39_9EURO|nr:hypothetical protein AYL99_07970 [Fonsecaea erecta]OAP57232.1 hypothetical protein AYL99_07970 [Fonsecaea erecta]